MKSSKRKLEYMAAYEKRPDNVEKRVDRNRARRHALAAGKVHVGDGLEFDHVKRLDVGGSDSDKNTRIVTRERNRAWRKGMTKGKGYGDGQ